MKRTLSRIPDWYLWGRARQTQHNCDGFKPQLFPELSHTVISHLSVLIVAYLPFSDG